MPYSMVAGGERFTFRSLAELLGRANEEKSGDRSAGLAARSERERVAAKMALAEVRVSEVVDDVLVDDDVTEALLAAVDRPRLDSTFGSMTLGELREDVLQPSYAGRWAEQELGSLVTAEVAAGVAKLMSNLDLVLAAAPLRTVTRNRGTMGERGVFGGRLQPNHQTDDPRAIAISIIDGLSLGCGDAMIGINPANDSVESLCSLLDLLRAVIDGLAVPTQGCVLSHVTTQLLALERGAPIDLLFQSVAGTEKTNTSFGFTLAMLAEAREAVLAQHRADPQRYRGENVTYFETGQGSAQSADAHHGIDQLTCEARAQGVARLFDPFLVNSVVGFIGPEYLADGVQIARAGLEDHFMGKLMGIPMGCDVCYTNHVDADHNSNDSLLMQLALAGCTFVMGVPGGDDVMLSYQSTSFHDIASVRALTGTRPGPEFEKWLVERGLWSADGLVAADEFELSLRALTADPVRAGAPG